MVGRTNVPGVSNGGDQPPPTITAKSELLTTTGSWTMPKNIVDNKVTVRAVGGGEQGEMVAYPDGGRGGNGGHMKVEEITIAPNTVINYTIGYGGGTPAAGGNPGGGFSQFQNVIASGSSSNGGGTLGGAAGRYQKGQDGTNTMQLSNEPLRGTGTGGNAGSDFDTAWGGSGGNGGYGGNGGRGGNGGHLVSSQPANSGRGGGGGGYGDIDLTGGYSRGYGAGGDGGYWSANQAQFAPKPGAPGCIVLYYNIYGTEVER